MTVMNAFNSNVEYLNNNNTINISIEICDKSFEINGKMYSNNTSNATFCITFIVCMYNIRV